MSPYSDTLSGFRANQSLLFLLNAVSLAEKQQIPILIVLDLTRSWLEPTIYHTQGEHANHCTTDAVIFLSNEFWTKNKINL
jgi:flavoprotein